jgi:hypothetical protein
MGKFQEKQAVLSDGIFAIFTLWSSKTSPIASLKLKFLLIFNLESVSHDQSADFSSSAMCTFRGTIERQK